MFSVLASRPSSLNTVHVPFFDLSTQHGALTEVLSAAFQRVLNSGQFILGAEVEQLEAEAAAYLQVRHAIGVSSGTDALLLALMALEIQPGDEVLCPSFTFFATAGSIARLGAKPVFVDASPNSFNLDPRDAADKISPATRAIIPVHLFGQAAEMQGIMALADKHGLTVIEDAAQAIGAHYQDQPVGSFGHFGAFSFFPTKNLGGLGDGGLLTTQDNALAAKARALRVHGERTRYQHKYIGGNFRLDAIQAALLRVKLKHLEAYIAKRQAHAAYYNHRLKSLDENRNNPTAMETPGLTVIRPTSQSANRHSWNQYTLRLANAQVRDRLQAYLGDQGIGSAIYYPRTLDQQPCFAAFAASGENNHTAHQLANTCLSLPIYPELTDEQCAVVVDTVEHFFTEQYGH